MARKPKTGKSHSFRNKLLLNQWVISLFGIDPLAEHKVGNKKVRPFHLLADPIRSRKIEGLDHDNLHHFYHELVRSDLFWNDFSKITKEQILVYEQNISRHTQVINEKRERPIHWKYFQWLTLLFTEIYLDRYFSDPDRLLKELNEYVARFNAKWPTYADVLPFQRDDLNKVCMQNATGSGKTLLMHVNVLQFEHYAKLHGKTKDIARAILITPNERLSRQHIDEFAESSLSAISYQQAQGGLFGAAKGLERVDVLEITKLQDQQGPNTVATRSLGDTNLLLVDEGHRGISGQNAKKEESAWFKRRAMLSEKGFTFEYSATFEQAVSGTSHEDDYAKMVLFDYSYRWFYEDGFGKDYKIDNLPSPDKATIQRLIDNGNIAKASKLATDQQVADAIMPYYLTAALLKFYQQLLIYEENEKEFAGFNLEKPLWVFVGSTVSKPKGGTNDETATATDVAKVILFFAEFLHDPGVSKRRIDEILRGNGSTTGLLDQNGNDIFHAAFNYLAKDGLDADAVFNGILSGLFNHPAGGRLTLDRIKGDSGEIALRVGASETPFGLINVGNAKELCDHIEEIAGDLVTVDDSDFHEAQFETVKDSASPIHLLVGSKKFVEGWDCWRVSTMGLMHVGKSEGSQIIQLFGRGVRLKGYEWSLKRCGHSHAPVRPNYIEELETLNVFGIEADFMEKFRKFLADERLPGNERRETITIPLNVTYDFGKKLKILRPKRKKDGREYDFKTDGPVPRIGEIPDYLTKNPVVADWYSRIQAVPSDGEAVAGQRHTHSLRETHLSLLDWDGIFFEMERFKRERSWYNINVTKEGLRSLLGTPGWYELRIPASRLAPQNFDDVRLIQQVAVELVKRYCEHYYNYRKREYIEPRLELRELTPADDNFPKDKNGSLIDEYQLIVDGDETQVIAGLKKLAEEIAENKKDLLSAGDLFSCCFGRHLFQPLFHVRRGGKISIAPVSLNESEFQFVKDLKAWSERKQETLESEGTEIFLLRNMSRGKGVGFFEAQNFHPDFILWILKDGKQYVTFVEPHGLLHGSGLGDEKIKFHKRVKDVEKRLADPAVILNSFILSWTKYRQLKWDNTQAELEAQNVLFMTDDPDGYIGKMYSGTTATTPAPAS